MIQLTDFKAFLLGSKFFKNQTCHGWVLVVVWSFCPNLTQKSNNKLINCKNHQQQHQTPQPKTAAKMFLRPRLAYRHSSVTNRRTLRLNDDEALMAMMVLRPRDAYRHQSPKKRRVRKTLVHDFKQRMAKKRALTMIKTWTSPPPMHSNTAFIKSEPL